MRPGLGPVCALVAALAASGCGLFDEDERLEGERIRLRTDQVAAAQASGAQIALPEMRTNENWTQTNGRANHASGHLAGPAAPRIVWSRDIGAGKSDDGAITAAPIVIGGQLFVMDAEATVTALSVSDGARIWEADLAPEGESGDEGFGGGLASDGVLVFATTGFGEVLALDGATGEIRWRHRASAPFRAAPAVAGGVVVAVTRENRAVGLVTGTGETLWQTDGIAATAGMLGGASPALQGDLAVVPFTSGEVLGLERQSGRRVWSAVLGGARRGLARSTISDVTGDPVIAGNAVIVANQAGRMVAIDGRTGRRGWTRSIGATAPIWAAGRSIFLVSDDTAVVRLALETGETLWRAALPAYEDPEDREDPIAYSGPVLAGGRLWLSDSVGTLHSFDPLTGEARTTLSLSDGSVTGPIVAGGTLFVLSDNGVVQALR